MAADFPALDAEFNPSAIEATHSSAVRSLWRPLGDAKKIFVSSPAELMGLAIRAARSTAVEAAVGKRGGPFGAAAAIPQTLKHGGKEVSFAEWYRRLDPQAVLAADLPSSDVTSWKLIALGVNLVEVLGDASFHAEMVLGTYVTAATGRNWWKRFVLAATTGAPCGMCESFFTWACPRYLFGGAPIAEAVRAGLHEALPAALVKSIRENPQAHTAEAEGWVTNLRSRGIEVQTGVCSDEVVEQLYRPYLAAGGVLYNGGRDDPTG